MLAETEQTGEPTEPRQNPPKPAMPQVYPYRVVETALAALFQAVDVRHRPLFRARFVDAQKLGVLGINPGTGRPHDYTRNDILRLLLFFDLVESGSATRVTAAWIVTTYWNARNLVENLGYMFSRADFGAMNRDAEDVLIAITGLRAMSGPWHKKRNADFEVRSFTKSNVGEFLDGLVAHEARLENAAAVAIIVNLSSRIRALNRALSLALTGRPVPKPGPGKRRTKS